MFALIRTLVYASLFIGAFLLYFPAEILDWSGIARPAATGAVAWTGLAIGTCGAAIALWCILTFGTIGRGTPAPFDPPRRLVTRGPYRFVRNPMYVGAGLALLGAAVFYRSVWLAAYAALFFAVTHLLVLEYEEPTLRRMFGKDYEAYCRVVGRWWPVRQRSP